ncbi:hypothetical protein [Pseudodesulfovibrio sediminis]|uniref:PilZ domain-containing protein n=1 Tax=Pseudodesulfovibrio sediminis TaxID=2810563 RepID=A0ABM7P3Y6_9BACT|nr:hypothetical protein [Pseudodesulfovibrio sediminis]BCS87562.1 hypothetical protein PSDVSF_08040 [Pseudodesulfovibrio sediminis]
MYTQDPIAALINSAVEWMHPFIPWLTPELFRLIGGTLLGLIALILLIVALRLLFRPTPRNTASIRTSIPRILQKRGVVLDVLASQKANRISVRCVITSASSTKIKCEIIDHLENIQAGKDETVTCMFAPFKTREGKVNSFTAKLLESERSGRKADRLILSGPTGYAMAPRRKHIRKRVADQQFVRVKLWIEDLAVSDIAFEDAIPQIGVNSFSKDGPDQGANGVINISDRGLGLSILNKLIPEICAEDSPVVINLFMFNFREKTFKPYWYAGTVRSMKAGRPGFTRIGIEFDAVAHPDRETGKLSWNAL